MAIQTMPEAGIAGKGHSLPVLLVEDNDGDAALLDASLTGTCTGSPLHPFVQLTRARTLEEGLQHLRSGQTGVILLDLGLPDSSGLETLVALRAQTDLPIVVLTGLADEQIALEALKSGAQDYLFKGDVSPVTTLRALRYATERYEQQRELAQARYLAGIGETVLAVLHEVNNPLTSLLMNAELLKSGDPDPRLVDAMVEAAQRIASVTKRLSQLRTPQTVEGARGLRMLDLSQGPNRR